MFIPYDIELSKEDWVDWVMVIKSVIGIIISSGGSVSICQFMRVGLFSWLNEMVNSKQELSL